MTTIKAGDGAINLIKRFEGLSLVPYNCPAGHATIGYGHKLHSGVMTEADKVGHTGFSEAEAEAMLKADVTKFEVYVQRQVPSAINQNQFDALVSLAYNCPSALATGTGLSKALGAHDWAQAGEEILRWHHVGTKDVAGLLSRRIAEKALFCKALA